jgi:alkylhydroperoxidase family enzyme
MPYIPLLDEPRGLIGRFAYRYARRKFGSVVQPVRAAAHHNGVLMASGALETVVEKSWTKLDPSLRWLAVQCVAGQIGCSWCTDFGYYLGKHQNIDPAKVTDIARWRTTDVYTEQERLVLDYAESASATPAVVPESLVEALRNELGDEATVELASWVALEHYRSRFNAGLGLHSEGFSDNCDVDLSGQPTAAHAGG